MITKKVSAKSRTHSSSSSQGTPAGRGSRGRSAAGSKFSGGSKNSVRSSGSGSSKTGSVKRGSSAGGLKSRSVSGEFSTRGSRSSSSVKSTVKGSSRGKQPRPIRPSKPVRRFSSEIREREDLDKSLELGQRLQIVLAAAGYGSRRNCEELITTGRVLVDGKVVDKLGARVFPLTQKIQVDGELLTKTRPAYIVIYKPKGVLCTNFDPDGRPRAIDCVPEKYGRLFPVGRLDQASEGLLLMTNDGMLAQRLTHPRYEVAKKYKVQVAGFVENELITQLKKGIHLAEAVVQADEVVFKARYKNSSILEIVLREGKNREIRRMLARLGHKVMQLQRVAIGPVKLMNMIPGEYRELTKGEVNKLYEAAGLTR